MTKSTRQYVSEGMGGAAGGTDPNRPEAVGKRTDRSLAC